jgi:hypothetical protein
MLSLSLSSTSMKPFFCMYSTPSGVSISDSISLSCLGLIFVKYHDALSFAEACWVAILHLL